MSRRLRYLRESLVASALAGLLICISACGSSAEYGPDPELSEPALRRLTEAQYIHAIEDLFGDDLFVPTGLEPDLRARGLVSVGASLASVSPRGVEGFERAGYIVAAQIMEPERRSRIMSCDPLAIVDNDCARDSLAPLARRAWRRSATAEELDSLVAIAGHSAETLGDFHAGFEFALSTLLQYPDFLYRVELGASDPEGRWERRFDDFELASRLSFFLWDSIPDEELLDAAEAGELSTDEGLSAQLDRMLDSERSRVGLRAWFADILHLSDLDELYKDPQTFLQMSDTLGASAREETLLVFEDLALTEQRDMRELLTTRKTFLNRELATLYSVQAPAREGFAPYEFAEDGNRRGLLGHASFLASNSHPASTSPTLRGKFIREVLLCQILPGPPAEVDTSIPPPSEEAVTLRERVQQHLTNPACSGCHRPMDLLGLGLENFDGIGAYRSQDNGQLIDASGEVDEVEFADHSDLAEVLAEHEAFTDCLSVYMFRAALGQGEEPPQNTSLNWLHERFAEGGFQLRPALRALLMSAMFRKAGELEPAPPDPLPPIPSTVAGPAADPNWQDRL
jgi:hypothetical protein